VTLFINPASGDIPKIIEEAARQDGIAAPSGSGPPARGDMYDVTMLSDGANNAVSSRNEGIMSATAESLYSDDN